MGRHTADKKFRAFLAGSLLLHGLFLWLLMTLPDGKSPVATPTMIDLGDIRIEENRPVRAEQPSKRLSEQMSRVERERAPRGERGQIAPGDVRMPPATTARRSSPADVSSSSQKTVPAETPRATDAGGTRLRRPARTADGLEKLFPSSDRLAAIEEGYRKKYGPEVDDSDTAFLNTDDIQFGSFLHRFENAIYGVWRYPADAARMGIEGVAAVRITFNRRGEVEKYEILEGSGSKLLDDEVKRALKSVGRIGGFPSGYDKEYFHLIAFFHYSIIRGSVRGTLR